MKQKRVGKLKLTSQFTIAQWSIGIVSLLVSGVFGLAYFDAVSNFEKFNKTLARTVSTEVANHVSYILKERQRQVTLFAQDHTSLLSNLVLKPEDEIARAKVERELKRVFPTFFSFTVTNVKGEPYFVDFDGIVGDVCIQDIQSFSNTGNHIARIHPNSQQYHYDVIAEWKNQNDTASLLMISFAVGMDARNVIAGV